MYLAKQNEDYSMTLYISIFKDLQKGQGNSYKEDIDTILLDANQILRGDKDINSIDNEYFFLTAFLIDNAEEELKELEDKDINPELYSRLLKILEGNVTFA